MLVTVQCPQSECRKTFEIDAANLGRRARCRSCGSRFVLTGTENTNGDATQTVDGAAGANEESRDRSPRGDIPAQMGRFAIRRRLGVGAFGTVYQAFDPVLNREVAIKVPRTSTLQDERARTRFLREPKAAAQLRHPNIVPVFDAGDDGEHYYIASAYIQGTNLEALVDSGEIDLRTAAEIIRDLAEALQYAHRLGIVHRDVKPANVMIDEQGQPLLMDFGLAHIAESEEKLTQDGTLMGTPAYMSPEQADRSFGEVGAASDQYSLGVTFYELLCGERPFSGPPSVVIHNTVTLTPDSPRKRNPRVPSDLETICLKALAKRPGDRFTDCSELADELRRWLEGEPVRTRRRSSAEKFTQWARRKPAMAGLSTAFIVTTFVFIAVLWSQWYSSEQKRQELEQAGGTIQEQERRIADQRSQISATDEEVQKRLAETEQLRSTASTAQEEVTGLRSRVKTLEQYLQEAEFKSIKAETEAQRSQKVAIENALATKESLATKEAPAAKKYFEVIVEAEQYASVGDFDGAQKKLNSCPVDARGFEWHHTQQIIEGRVRFLSVKNMRGLAYRQDGTVVVVQDDGKVLAWELETDTRRMIADMQMEVRSHKFTPDGDFVAAIGKRDVLKVIDTVAEKLVLEQTLVKRDDRRMYTDWLEISPRGKYVWVGGARPARLGEAVSTLVLDTATGTRVAIPTVLPLTFIDEDTLLQTSALGTTAISLTGKQKLFSRGLTRRIGNQIWSGEGKLLSTKLEEIPFAGPTPLTVSKNWIASSPSGDLVASSGNGNISIWKTGEYHTPVRSLGHDYPAYGVTFSLGPDGSSALIWRNLFRVNVTTSVIHLPDLDRLKANKLVYKTDAENQVVALSASGKRIITQSTRQRSSCEIRDLTKKGTTICGFEMANNAYNYYSPIAVADQGELIATGITPLKGSKSRCQITACRDRVLTTITLGGRIRWCKFSPNGELFAIRDDSMTTLWAIPSGDEVNFPLSNVVAMAFTSDGSRLVTLERLDSDRNLLKVWDIKSATAISEFSFGGSASSLALTADDRKVLVGIGKQDILICHFENMHSNLTLKTNVEFFDLAATKEHILLATSTGIHVIGDPSKSPFEDVAPSRVEPEAASVGP